MNKIKRIKRNRGQAAIEYFLLLAAIGALTAISMGRLWPDVRESLQGNGGFFNRAADGLIHADGSTG